MKTLFNVSMVAYIKKCATVLVQKSKNLEPKQSYPF